MMIATYEPLPPEQTEAHPFIRNFIYIALTLTFFLALIILLIWYSLVQNEKRIIKDEENYQLKLGVETISRTFDSIITDTKMFSGLSSLREYCCNANSNSLTHLTDSFFEVGKYQYKYDQIRFIGTNGDELVRLNQIDGTFSLVPDSLLQNKSDRYYFQAGMQLELGEMYVSPFDLNIDNNIVENKPMIRFTTPVADSLGYIKGLLVLNYLGDYLKQQLDDLEIGTESHIQLLNTDGYWIHNEDPLLEWGFMFDNRQNESFTTHFSDEWKIINSSNSGQFETRNGIFSYTHIYPLSELTHMQSQIFPQNSSYSWIFVSQVSRSELTGLVLVFMRPFIILATLMEIMVVFGAALLSHAETRRKYALTVLKQAAQTDPLTGLLNRRRFNERFEVESARYHRLKKPFSIIMADIDQFKSLNDLFGHNTGDYILSEISGLFKHSLREIDIIGRWGGEEFIFLLPETEGSQAESVAEKLRTIVANTHFTQTGQRLRVTLSFGVCEISNEQNLNDLVKKADIALYRSKEAGRNTVTLYSPD